MLHISLSPPHHHPPPPAPPPSPAYVPPLSLPPYAHMRILGLGIKRARMEMVNHMTPTPEPQTPKRPNPQPPTPNPKLSTFFISCTCLTRTLKPEPQVPNPEPRNLLHLLRELVATNCDVHLSIGEGQFRRVEILQQPGVQPGRISQQLV